MDINAEQKRIAFQDPKGHALLKGVAGSGKTSVGICRIPFLLQNYCFAKDDAILVATYNRTLVGYMTHLYEKMDCKEFAAFTSLFAATEDKLEIRTVDSLMYPYYRQYAQEKGIECNVWARNSTLYEILSDGISKIKKDFPDVPVLKQKHTGFLLDEITWIKDCLYLEEEEYQTADRVGKVKAQQANQPQRLLKNSDTRKAIFNLMLYFDDQLRKRGLATFSDMRIWALERARKETGQRYTHIIVDESQDLTRAQLLFLKLIYNPKDYASFLFIADTAQSIYPQSWLGSGRSFTSIGFNMTGKSQSLSKNFRTTTQISQAAYSLIENCADIVEDDNFVKPTLIEKQGDYPVYRSFENEKAQSEFLCREIRALIDKVPARDCAVIARFKNQLNQIKTALESEGIKCSIFTDKESSFDSDHVKLVTMHSIKGLEFRVVFIVDLNDRVLPYFASKDQGKRDEEEARERRLLYVGMTRATQQLYLLSSSKPSTFIADIDPKFLRIDRHCRLKRFYNVSTRDYRFKDRIHNLHANEEKIRQWMLSELVDTYGYPLSSIAVEYPVKAFSQKGFVDIAVLIRKEGQGTPLVFIETKQPGHSLDDGLHQVQSYMSHCRPCRYGAVTDGNDFLVIERDFKPVSDIPIFKASWGSSSMRVYRHRNLKTGLEHALSVDESDPSRLEVQSHDGSTLVEGKDVYRLPVYGNVAAGQPLQINPELEDRLYFPKNWHRGADHFGLKVSGDSMQNAGIEAGDCVVVRQQPMAANLDIAVVAIGGDATLKRFTRMGENVILLSENPAYDPILLSEGQVSILGIAVGVVKNG